MPILVNYALPLLKFICTHIVGWGIGAGLCCYLFICPLNKNNSPRRGMSPPVSNSPMITPLFPQLNYTTKFPTFSPHMAFLFLVWQHVFVDFKVELIHRKIIISEKVAYTLLIPLTQIWTYEKQLSVPPSPPPHLGTACWPRAAPAATQLLVAEQPGSPIPFSGKC